MLANTIIQNPKSKIQNLPYASRGQALIMAVLRNGCNLLNIDSNWQLIIIGAMIILAVLTMIVGNVLALPQRNLKRMLAYSSIAHAGYLTLGLIAAGKSGDHLGVGAILFYLAGYVLMNLGAFGVLIWVRNRRRFAYSLDEMGGLSRTMPWAAIRIRFASGQTSAKISSLSALGRWRRQAAT